MKKTIINTVLLFFLAAVFISCGTTKEVQSAPDTYVSEDEITVPQVTDSEKTEKIENAARVNSAAKQKNFFEDFFTFGNKNDFLIIDTSTVFTKEITGLKEKSANVLIRYDNKMAGFASYNSMIYYCVLFDKENRAILKRAAESYFSDFENKRLNRKGKKTDKAYGKINYRLDWGTVSSSTPNNGSGEGYCGYEFVKGSPYFTIYNYEFENAYYESAGDATTRTSKCVKYYFTRSQLRQLLNILSEDNINTQMLENAPVYIMNPTTLDEY